MKYALYSNVDALLRRFEGDLMYSPMRVLLRGRAIVYRIKKTAIYLNRHFDGAAVTERLTSMAFIPVPACVQARPQFQTTTGVVAENVLYFATSSVPTMDDLTGIGDMLADWIRDAWALNATSNWEAVGINLRAMNEAEGLELAYNTGFPHVGGDSSAPAPNNVSYTVTLSTGLVGRSARGRVYGLAIPNVGVVNGNRLADATRAVFQTHWDALRLAANAAGYGWQVVSFQEGGVPRTTGRALPVLSVNVRFPVATQRRRLA